MITLFIAFYAFMAGMMAEYTHTTLKEPGDDDGIVSTSIIAAVLWPIVLWKGVK